MEEVTNAAGSARIGRTWVLAAAVLWSLSGAFVKTLQMPPATVAMYRTLSAGLLLLAVLMALRVRPTWHRAMIPMVLAFSAMNYVFVSSLTYTTSANAIFLQYTAPLWMTVGSVLFLGESSDRRQWTVLLGSLVGVGVIVVGNRGAGGSHQLGIALGLLSGVFYASVAISLRFLRSHDPLWLTTLNHLGAGVLLLIWNVGWVVFGSVSESTLAFPSNPTQGALLIGFGVIQMGLPYLLFSYGLQRVSAQEAGILTLVEPVLNPVWTAVATSEIPSAATVAGGCILLLMLLARYVPRSGVVRA